MEVYMLVMARFIGNEMVDYDVFGLYSSMEKAEEAKRWRRRGDGLYQGVRPDLVYNWCEVTTRIIDHNLPKEDN